MVKIAFWDNSLSERGTSIALYDYAFFNVKLLGNESIILYNSTRTDNCVEVINKFKIHFNVVGLDSFSKVDDVLLKENCDILYIIKSGEQDNQLSKVCKTVVHCVFNCSHPQGNVYASISPWISGNNGKYQCVPHMINLPDTNENMRTKLNIPENATVYGRHGGYYQFDIPYVQKIVYDVAISNPHIYFLFVNTKPFVIQLKNIIHLDKIIDLHEKVVFINTCDAMLWGRSDGETFGLSIGEFSTKNKPIFATLTGDCVHAHILQNKGLWYNESNLHQMLIGFNKNAACLNDWNAYQNFEPEKVMDQFKTVFID